jgi:hypothetical protein
VATNNGPTHQQPAQGQRYPEFAVELFDTPRLVVMDDVEDDVHGRIAEPDPQRAGCPPVQ